MCSRSPFILHEPENHFRWFSSKSDLHPRTHLGKQALADVPGGLLLPFEKKARSSGAVLWCQGGWRRLGPPALQGRTGALPAVWMLQLYLLAPAPLPISLPIACTSPYSLRRSFCKPSSFEQCQLHVEADFLYIDAVFLSQLVVSGSSQANCSRAYFIAAYGSTGRNRSNALPAQKEKRRVGLQELPGARQQPGRGGHVSGAHQAGEGTGMLSVSRGAWFYPLGRVSLL